MARLTTLNMIAKEEVAAVMMMRVMADPPEEVPMILTAPSQRQVENVKMSKIKMMVIS